VYQLVTLASLSLVMLSVPPQPVGAQSQPEASPNDYKVYEAVLGLMDHIPKEDPHVTIFSVTLNSKCGEAASPSPLANGCTFLWMQPDNAASVKKLLRTEWPELQNSTWTDFTAQNAESANLQEPIATPWKHKLVGPGDEPSKDWDAPDLTIFLSRVGFNPAKTEAIVYVLIFSYMDRVATGGDYFFFRTDKSGHWQPAGRLNYFTKDKDPSSQ
jgi:hypothetical protein